MLVGLYLSTMGAVGEDAKVDAIANNLANVNTTGFKKQFLTFQQREVESVENGYPSEQVHPVLDKMGGGLFIFKNNTDFSEGNFEYTDDDLNLAIDGNSFFAVSDGKKTYYTKSGEFRVTRRGDIVTMDGKYDLLDDGGEPINIGTDSIVSISKNGMIYVSEEGGGTTEVGTIGIYDFNLPGDLKRHGDTTFELVSGATPVSGTGRIMYKVLERSNVNPLVEMVDLIRAFRAYEANMNLVSQHDVSLGRAVNDVGRVQFG